MHPQPIHRLHLFPFSNYCEKVLWAFDYLSVDYIVQTHFAGPHAKAIKKLSGQTAVPVLETTGVDGQSAVTAGSATIIAHIMSTHSYADLLPVQHSAEILKWQERLDAIGGTLRGTLFYEILPNPNFAVGLLSAGQKGAYSPYGLFFRGMIPMLQRMLKRGIPDPDAARQECMALLDEIASSSEKTGYLVGDKFTLADLCAAAVFFPICMPPGCMGYAYHQENDGLELWLKHWEGHAAIPYIQRMYSDHRR